MDDRELDPVIPDLGGRPAVRRKGIGAAPILITGFVVVCFIWIFARNVLVSNSAEAPKGLDTGTINTNVEVPPPEESRQESEAGTVTSVTVPVEVISSESSETETSAAEEEVLGVMYITEYVQLHKEPSNDSENIVCMSPGIAVNVLEYDDTGYVKITFMNVDGPATGYVWRDYLSEVQTVIPSWQQ